MQVSSFEAGGVGLAILGTLGSVCGVLLRSNKQNLKSLEVMRREAFETSQALRLELKRQETHLLELQQQCAEHCYQLGQLTAQKAALERELQRLRQQEVSEPEKSG